MLIWRRRLGTKLKPSDQILSLIPIDGPSQCNTIQYVTPFIQNQYKNMHISMMLMNDFAYNVFTYTYMDNLRHVLFFSVEANGNGNGYTIFATHEKSNAIQSMIYLVLSLNNIIKQSK